MWVFGAGQFGASRVVHAETLACVPCLQHLNRTRQGPISGLLKTYSFFMPDCNSFPSGILLLCVLGFLATLRFFCNQHHLPNRPAIKGGLGAGGFGRLTASGQLSPFSPKRQAGSIMSNLKMCTLRFPRLWIHLKLFFPGSGHLGFPILPELPK